jgi:hypothetical protein
MDLVEQHGQLLDAVAEGDVPCIVDITENGYVRYDIKWLVSHYCQWRSCRGFAVLTWDVAIRGSLVQRYRKRIDAHSSL